MRLSIACCGSSSTYILAFLFLGLVRHRHTIRLGSRRPVLPELSNAYYSARGNCAAAREKDPAATK